MHSCLGNGPHSLWRTRVIVAVFICQYTAEFYLGTWCLSCSAGFQKKKKWFIGKRDGSLVNGTHHWTWQSEFYPLTPHGHGENWILKVILHTCDTLLQFLSKYLKPFWDQPKYCDIEWLLCPIEFFILREYPLWKPTYQKDIIDILHFWLWREWVFPIGTAC